MLTDENGLGEELTGLQPRPHGGRREQAEHGKPVDWTQLLHTKHGSINICILSQNGMGINSAQNFYIWGSLRSSDNF